MFLTGKKFEITIYPGDAFREFLRDPKHSVSSSAIQLVASLKRSSTNRTCRPTVTWLLVRGSWVTSHNPDRQTIWMKSMRAVEYFHLINLLIESLLANGTVFVVIESSLEWSFLLWSESSINIQEKDARHNNSDKNWFVTQDVHYLPNIREVILEIPRNWS